MIPSYATIKLLGVYIFAYKNISVIEQIVKFGLGNFSSRKLGQIIINENLKAMV